MPRCHYVSPLPLHIAHYIAFWPPATTPATTAILILDWYTPTSQQGEGAGDRPKEESSKFVVRGFARDWEADRRIERHWSNTTSSQMKRLNGQVSK